MKPELLMPAGSKEKLEYAARYGADAVYLGMVDFSLRSMRKGEIITGENLKSAIDLAHSLGKKAYLTLNIYAFNNDIENLIRNVDIIKDANPDAIILSDFGIYSIVKKYLPNTPIHISTQTNTLNYEAVEFWRDLGAKRVILGREVSIQQMKEIRNKVNDVELEVFVHGSQCVSFSGRCLLSDYMTDFERKANHGNCAQPCRWSYKLLEETRPGEYFEITQDNHGTHILSPKDLALVKYIPELIDAGIDSFKIEGRTKSLYYVSAIAKTYRRAIDDFCSGEGINEDYYWNELIKVGNRGYTTGFYKDKPDYTGYSYDISKGLAGADFLCVFLDKQEGKYRVKIKNKICLNDEIEIITPSELFTTTVTAITTLKNEAVEVANTNDEIFITLEINPKEHQYALARTIGVKNLR